MYNKWTFVCRAFVTILAGILLIVAVPSSVYSQGITLENESPCYNDTDFIVTLSGYGQINNVRWSITPTNAGSVQSVAPASSVNSETHTAHIKWTSQFIKNATISVVFDTRTDIDRSATKTVRATQQATTGGIIRWERGTTPPGPVYKDQNVSYILNLNLSDDFFSLPTSYKWFQDGVEQLEDDFIQSFNFSTIGAHVIKCTPYNACGAGSTKTATINVVCPVDGFTIAGSRYLCPGTPNTTLKIEPTPTESNLTYVWRKDGSVISGASAAQLQVTSAGAYTVAITSTVDNCSITTPSFTVENSTPPTALITAVKSQPLGFTGEPVLLEVTGAADATNFNWTLQAGGGADYFRDASGDNSKRKVYFTPPVPGNPVTVNVTPVRNACEGASKTHSLEIKSTSVLHTDSVVMKHSNLLAGDVGYLNVVKHSPDYKGCLDVLGPVTVSVALDLGRTYNLGKNPFKSDIQVTVIGHGVTPEDDVTMTFPLHVDQSAPEQLFQKRITVNPASIRYFTISTSGYTNPGPVAATYIRLTATYTEEDVVDISSASVTPVKATQPTEGRAWEQTFTWTNNCVDVTDYLFQILKLEEGDARTVASNSPLWKDALLIQTESAATSITLSMGEGSGKYYWRVTPLGNLPGGLSNPENLGRTSSASTFDYVHPEKDKNWIYSRTFTEGNKVSERVTYANGLQQIAQQEIRIQGENKIVATQTIQDYVGRSAVTSLPVPLAKVKSLGYVEKVLANGGHAYRAEDFDDRDTPAGATDKVGYYGGVFIEDAENDRVASAENYPFAQTIFSTDGSGRVKEQAGVGLVHSKAGGKTVRTYYETAQEAELVRLFGSEAPLAKSVQKITTYDANNVPSVTFQTKDGKVIATALTLTGETNGPLENLADVKEVKTVSEVKTNQRVDNFTVVSRTPLSMEKTDVIHMKYEIETAQLQELCGGSSNSDMVGYYPFDGNARDMSGHNNHGTASLANLSNDARGSLSAYSLTGITNSYIQMGDSPDNDFGAEDFTVSYWIKRATTTSASNNNWSHAPGVGKWANLATAGGNEWALLARSEMNSNTPAFVIESGTVPYKVVANTSLNAGTWYHLVGVRQGNTLKIYIDGRLDKTFTIPISAPVAINSTSLPLQIGRVGTAYTAGVFDDVQLYRRALSDDEIIQLKNRGTICVSCDYKVSFRFLEGGVPVPGVNIPSKVISGSPCGTYAAGSRFTIPDFSLPVTGGKRYVLEKYLTLNNKTKRNSTRTYLDSTVVKIDSVYRSQAHNRLQQVYDLLKARKLPELRAYLRSVASGATFDGVNNRYVLPLLPPGSAGCPQFIYIPEVELCPAEPVVTNSPCTVNGGLTFEGYFEKYYEGRADITNPNNGALEYLYFTNHSRAENKDQYFPKGQFDAMVSNLIAQNTHLNVSGESACERVWRIWRAEVVAYEVNNSYVPTTDNTEGIEAAVPAKFDLFKTFINALDMDLQSALTQATTPCTDNGPASFILRDLLYGKIGGLVTNNTTPGQMDPSNLDLTQAHRLVYYSEDVLAMKAAMQFYADIPRGSDKRPRDPIMSDFTTKMSDCAIYKLSKSTGLGDIGISNPTDPILAAAAQLENIQKIKDKCNFSCENRREEFRQAIINRLFELNEHTVLENYRVYKDDVYHQGLWIGVYDNTLNTEKYTVSVCELDRLADALVDNCKNNYCNVTLTTQEILVPGTQQYVQVYGTAQEIEKIKKASTYNFEVALSSPTGSGWDVIPASATPPRVAKTLMEMTDDSNEAIWFQSDGAGNLYSLYWLNPGKTAALRMASGTTAQMSNNTDRLAILLVKYNASKDAQWYRYFESRTSQSQARSATAMTSTSNTAATGTGVSEPTVSLSANGDVLFTYPGGGDVYMNGQRIASFTANGGILSTKLNSSGVLQWARVNNVRPTATTNASRGTFSVIDNAGNSYISSVEGIIKLDAGGNVVWMGDRVDVGTGSVGMLFDGPEMTVDNMGNVYLLRAGFIYTNGPLRLNNTIIDNLTGSQIALVLLKFHPNGRYAWHQSISFDEGFAEDIKIMGGNNSVFLFYNSRLRDPIRAVSEWNIDTNVGTSTNRLYVAEIGSDKKLKSQGYYDHSKTIGILPLVSRRGDVCTFIIPELQDNSRFRYVFFDMATATFTQGRSENIPSSLNAFNSDPLLAVITPENSTGLQFVDKRWKPFLVDGVQVPTFSAQPIQMIWVESDNNKCARRGLYFKFTEPRAVTEKPDSIPAYDPKIEPCDTLTARYIRNAVDQQVEQLLTSRVAAFREQYHRVCSDPAMIDDKLTFTMMSGLHYFTLYYYDRGGNLVRTVPPAGVDTLAVYTPNLLATARTQTPVHRMVTEYQYNTLGQLIRQHTPDGNYLLNYGTDGTSAPEAAGFVKPTATDETTLNSSKHYNTLIYNDKGQLRFSRNAQQKLDGFYSYTKYDELGRVIEGGEARSYNETAVMVRRNEMGPGAFPVEETQFVTRTIYTLPFETVSVDGWPSIYHQNENNLLNRVSFTYLDKDGKNGPVDDRTYTIYDYDVHGNVRWLVQKMPGLAPVGMRYEYDLLTKSVNAVAFSPENSNASFYHRYEYDANKRLKKVQTSRDGNRWETEATYNYYLHGLLKRMTLGEDSVQGVDYTYTVQGWLKGINHGMLDPNIDPGKDALGSSIVGRDAFGMALGYYAGDYKNTSEKRFDEELPGNFSPKTGEGLYNGNIVTWTSNQLYPSGSGINYPQLTANKYRYDRLNRLLTSRFHTYNTQAQAQEEDFPAVDRYKSKYTYDANGNIMKAVTGSNTATDLDRITYKYELLNNYKINNRLNSASDSTGLVTGFSDDLEPGQVAYNYQYDAIGNLTHDRQQQVVVTWNMYGKVEDVTRTQAGKNYVTSFIYDAAGNRVVKKRINPGGLIVTDYYVRDATGNIMGVYQKTEQGGQSPETLITELSIYGGARIGTYSRALADPNGEELTEIEEGELRISENGIKNQYEERSYLLNAGVELTISPGFEYQASAESTFRIRAGIGSNQQIPEPLEGTYTRILSSRRYQLTDHLRNVRATTTDIKLSTISGNVTTDYRPDVVDISNYYPFGMEMPERSWNSGGKYRYGFNGKEKDDGGEWGTTNYDYGFRIYNPSIGKFLSVDPLTKEYSWYTPYQFAGNTPIQAIDRDGLEESYVIEDDLVARIVVTTLYDIKHSLVNVYNASQGFNTRARYKKDEYGNETFETEYYEREKPKSLKQAALNEFQDGLDILNVYSAGRMDASDLLFSQTGAGSQIIRSVRELGDRIDWNAVVPSRGRYRGEIRTDHIRRHNVDDLSKPDHGIFNGDGVDLTDKVWEEAKRLNLSPDASGTLVVPWKNAGKAGGSNAVGRPEQVLDNVTLFLVPGTNQIISAFPSN